MRHYHSELRDELISLLFQTQYMLQSTAPQKVHISNIRPSSSYISNHLKALLFLIH
jgi:hypothetical protein